MEQSRFEHIWNLMRNSNFEMASDVDTDLICTICQHMMINACNVPCGCRHCWQCIKDYLGDERKPCPGETSDCRNEMISFNRNVLIDQPINNRIVKAVVKCPRRFCEFQDELRKIEDHMNVCDIRPLNCPFANIGCSETELFNEIMKNHLVADIYSHSNLLMASINNFRNDIGLMQADIGVLRQENRDLRTEIDELKSDREADRLTIADLQEWSVDHVRKVDEDVIALRREITNTKGAFTAFAKERQVNEREMARLKRHVAAMNTENSVLKEEIKALNVEIKSQQESERQVLQRLEKVDLGIVTFEQNNKSFRVEIDALKLEGKRREAVIAELQTNSNQQSQKAQTLNQRFQKIENQLHETEKESEKKQNEINFRITDLATRAANMISRSDYNKLDKDVKELRKDLSGVNMHMVSFLNERETNQINAAATRLEMDKIKKLVETMKTENSVAKEEIKALHVEIKKYKESREQLLQRIENLIKNSHSVKEEIDELKLEENRKGALIGDLQRKTDVQSKNLQILNQKFEKIDEEFLQGGALRGKKENEIRSQISDVSERTKSDHNKMDHNLKVLRSDLAVFTKDIQTNQILTEKLQRLILTLINKKFVTEDEMKLFWEGFKNPHIPLFTRLWMFGVSLFSPMEIQATDKKEIGDLEKLSGHIVTFMDNNKSMKEDIDSLKVKENRNKTEIITLQAIINQHTQDIQMIHQKWRNIESQFQDSLKQAARKQDETNSRITDISTKTELLVKKSEQNKSDQHLAIVQREMSYIKDQLTTMAKEKELYQVQISDVIKALNQQTKNGQTLSLKWQKIEDQFQETLKETGKKQDKIEIRISDVNEVVKRYETKANEMEIKIHELEISQELDTITTHLWNIEKFSNEKENDKKIQCNPYFTHKNGYKFCLEADFRNDKDYLTIYFGLRRGPFDVILQWPFKHVVRLGLINQKTGIIHKSNTLNPENWPNRSYWNRPITKSNDTIGVQIMKIDELLKLPELFQGDTISIQCTVKING